MKEVSQLALPPRLAKVSSEHYELVVVHPDGIALIDVRGEKLGETRIDLLVDSLLGPVQVAAAYNNEDNWTAYLNIGFSFTQLFY